MINIIEKKKIEELGIKKCRCDKIVLNKDKM